MYFQTEDKAMNKLQVPPEGLLQSMALRYDHSLGINSMVFKNGSFDMETDEEREERVRSVVEKMAAIYSVVPDLPLAQKPDNEVLEAMAQKYKEVFEEKIVRLKGKLSDDRIDDSLKGTMLQLYEEISGFGFYQYR